MSEDLFRKEALDHRLRGSIGDASRLQLPSFALLASIAALVGTAIIVFLASASYSRSVHLDGVLASHKDPIQVYSSVSGVVAERRVSAGMHVHSGQALVTLTQDGDVVVRSPEQVLVFAPADGFVTTVHAETGQRVEVGSLLFIEAPVGSLQAVLFAPSRAVGLLEIGQAIKLRYQAFPYASYGQFDGNISAISWSPLTPSKDQAFRDGQSAEPLYEIKVSLTSQAVFAYGKSRPLQPGMRVSADIILDRRNVYELALEPLRSARGHR